MSNWRCRAFPSGVPVAMARTGETRRNAIRVEATSPRCISCVGAGKREHLGVAKSICFHSLDSLCAS